METARLPIILEVHEDLEEGLIPSETQNLCCECCNGPWCERIVPWVVAFNVIFFVGLTAFVIVGFIEGNKIF